MFGVDNSGAFAFDWENNQGAAGYMGLTLHATAAGKPAASITLSGYSTADLGSRINVQFGANADSGSYLYVHAT